VIALRDYQARLVREARDTFAGLPVPGLKLSQNARATGKIRRILLVLPTGGGKTVLFSAMASGVSRQGKRAAVLVHRDFLMRQVASALQMAQCQPGLAGVQMVAGYAKQPRAVDLLVLDEAHHATATTWRKAIDLAEKQGRNLWVVGVTATPERLDGAGLGDIFDAMIEGPAAQWLVDHGYLVEPRIFGPPAKVDTQGLSVRGGDFAAAELAERASRIMGDVVEQYQRIAPGTRAVVFAATVESAEQAAAKFRAAGISAKCLHGQMGTPQRDQTIADFCAGRTQILTSCEIVSEGFDLPAIETAILLRPTKSLALYLQQVGRALRTYAGKSGAIVIDHTDNTAEHGHPLWPREWSLDAPRRKAGAKQASGLKLWTCPVCFCIQQATNPGCSSCGHQRAVAKKPTRIEAGNLVEIAKGAPKKSKPAQAISADQVRARLRKVRTREELLEIAEAAGYSPKWAYVQMGLRPWLKRAGAQ